MYNIYFFLILLIIGYLSGRWIEKRHFSSIIKREDELSEVLTFAKRYPNDLTEKCHSALVCGNVVISIDYFKKIAASLRALVGGRVSAYESLIERARREAILRMKAKAKAVGADTIINVKLETASIYKGKKQQVGSVEVYAYGTALTKS
ncbi:MAG: YbjQ family protein [Cellvibrionaceae bacterium]